MDRIVAGIVDKLYGDHEGGAMDLEDLWEDDNRRLAKELGETKAHLAMALATIAKLEGKQYGDDVSTETEADEMAGEADTPTPTRVTGKRGLR